MDLETSLSLAFGNLLSVPVLAFILGILAAVLRTDLRLPDPVYQATSIYLLFAIGLKGGAALRESTPAEVIWPICAAVALGVLIPIAAFWILRAITPLGTVDRGAMAAHYGSTSLVTFTAALVFLDASATSYEGFMPTLLTLLEIPGIIVGLLLANRARSGDRRSNGAQSGSAQPWTESLREVLAGRSILLLAGGLVIGFLAGPSGYATVEPLFGALFTGVLALFLLEMGVIVGRRGGDLRNAGPGLIAFALAFPVLAGTAGIATGLIVGLSTGGAMILGVLCASASYIAAPAAVRLALPDANPGITLTASLGITFPFNLVIGIPLYLVIATALAGPFGT
jgi:hypothetical protein